jgi:hypothetical protein
VPGVGNSGLFIKNTFIACHSITRIKRGVKINDINSAILADKSIVPYDKESLYFEPRINIQILKFKQKYLKYKNKYLQLKKLLNK